MSYLTYSSQTVSGGATFNSSETATSVPSGDPSGVVYNVGATSGTFYQTAYRGKIYVEEVSTNTETNSGVYNIYFKMKTNTTGGWGYNSYRCTDAVFTVATDNDVNTDYSTTSGIRDSHTVSTNLSTYLIIGKAENVTLYHKEDGSLNITITITYGTTSDNYNPKRFTATVVFPATTLDVVPTFYAYDGSQWRKAKAIYAYDGSQWRKAKRVYVYNGSEWKKAK